MLSSFYPEPTSPWELNYFQFSSPCLFRRALSICLKRYSSVVHKSHFARFATPFFWAIDILCAIKGLSKPRLQPENRTLNVAKKIFAMGATWQYGPLTPTERKTFDGMADSWPQERGLLTWINCYVSSSIHDYSDGRLKEYGLRYNYHDNKVQFNIKVTFWLTESFRRLNS